MWLLQRLQSEISNLRQEMKLNDRKVTRTI